MDEPLLAVAERRLRDRAVTVSLVTGLTGVRDTAAMIGCASGVLTSSLHVAVTSVSFAVPCAVLGHSMDGKHQGTLSTVGLTDAVTTKISDLPVILSRMVDRDLEEFAVTSRSKAGADLDTALSEVRSDTSRRAKTDARQTFARGSTALLDEERSRLSLISIDTLKRVVFSTLRRSPTLSRMYARLRLRRRLAVRRFGREAVMHDERRPPNRQL